MNGTDFPPPATDKIRMRPHLRDFLESMALTCYVAEADDVVAYINCFYPQLRGCTTALTQRYRGLDPRNDWNSWVVSIGASPILWTDKPIPGITEQESAAHE